MKTKINGIETNGEITVAEFVEMQIKKGKFEESAEGFKTNITQEAERIQNATELLKEVGIESPISFFKNTKPMSESSYYRYAYERGGKDA